jgi:hypothetical protein
MRYESDNGMKSFILLFIGMLGLWVAGCTVLPQFGVLQSAQAPLLSPVALTVVPFSTAASFTPSPTPTTAPSSTPTSITEVSACPPPHDDADETVLHFDEIGFSFSGYNINREIPESEFISQTLHYLNSGGAYERIETIFRKQSIEMEIQSADLDTDGSDDLLFTLVQSGGFDGVGLFYCKNQRYQFAEWFSFGFNDSYRMVTIEDLNGDGFLEFIITGMGVGAYPSDFLHVRGWREHEVQDYWGMYARSWTRFLIQDQNGNGLPEIVFVGERDHFSVIRYVISTYEWNGEKYALISEILAPPQYRIHYLEDAHYALEEHDFDLAIHLYRYAIYEARSSYSESPADFEGNPYEIGFGYFRLVAIYYAQNNPQQATEIVQELQQRNADEVSPVFVKAIEAFVTDWNVSRDISTACTQAEVALDQFQEADETVLYNLGDLKDNFAIPRIPEESDWCPF